MMRPAALGSPAPGALIMKPIAVTSAAPSETIAWVRNPAGFICNSRLSPIAPPRTTARASRTAMAIRSAGAENSVITFAHSQCANG